MDLLTAIIGALTSKGWANFGQGTGPLLTGSAAIIALIIGSKSIKTMMTSEAIKVKMNEFMEANKRLSKKSKFILDELINDETEDGPIKPEQIEWFHEISISINKESYGTADVAQTFSFLLFHMMGHIRKNHKGNKSHISYRSMQNLMIMCIERIFNSSSNAVIAPNRIKLTPLHKSKKRYRKRITESLSRKIEGIPSGLDLSPTSSTVCGFYETFRSCIPYPEYLSALPFLLQSNEFIKISLEASNIYAPAHLFSLKEENLLGINENLWLIGFNISYQTYPIKTKMVHLFYMAENRNIHFIQNIESMDQIIHHYEDHQQITRLDKLFFGAKMEKPTDQILKISIPYSQCHKTIKDKIINSPIFR